jgi:hypothetical protein
MKNLRTERIKGSPYSRPAPKLKKSSSLAVSAVPTTHSLMTHLHRIVRVWALGIDSPTHPIWVSLTSSSHSPPSETSLAMSPHLSFPAPARLCPPPSMTLRLTDLLLSSAPSRGRKTSGTANHQRSCMARMCSRWLPRRDVRVRSLRAAPPRGERGARSPVVGARQLGEHSK